MAEDVVLTDLVVRDFDTLEEFNKHVGEIGDYDVVFTPDTTAKLWLFYRATSDRIVNEMSWLRANTFSWHNSDPYINAYNHLAGGLKPLYAWVDRAGSYGFNVFTESETPAVGDTVYGENGLAVGTCSSYSGGALAWTGSDGTAYSAWLRETSSDFPKQKTETIEGISIVCNVTPDGLKICLPDQESNIVALYEKVGSANYYILDETNKRFKLPRTIQRKLIRAYKNGTTWYNLYSDGWVEQGGFLNEEWTGAKTFDLPVAMSNTDYTVTDTVGCPNISGMNGQNWLTDKTTTSITFTSRSLAGNFTSNNFSWEVSGYAQTTPDMGIEHEYYYVGNFEQSAIEQTAGVATEALNAKADIDLGNLPANFDYIVEKQESSAENNYTWYFKFKSGWVIMGGNTNSVTSTGQINCSATLPVPVKTLPTILATPIYQSGGSVVVVTSYRSGNTIYVTLEKNAGGSVSTTASARWFAVGIAE